MTYQDRKWDYLQGAFRQQAEKAIRITKKNIESNEYGSFLKTAEEAYLKTKKRMVELGIYDEDGNLLIGTEEQAGEMFKNYHEAYLNQARTNRTNAQQDYMLKERTQWKNTILKKFS